MGDRRLFCRKIGQGYCYNVHRSSGQGANETECRTNTHLWGPVRAVLSDPDHGPLRSLQGDAAGKVIVDVRPAQTAQVNPWRGDTPNQWDAASLIPLLLRFISHKPAVDYE